VQCGGHLAGFGPLSTPWPPPRRPAAQELGSRRPVVQGRRHNVSAGCCRPALPCEPLVAACVCASGWQAAVGALTSPHAIPRCCRLMNNNQLTGLAGRGALLPPSAALMYLQVGARACSLFSRCCLQPPRALALLCCAGSLPAAWGSKDTFSSLSTLELRNNRLSGGWACAAASAGLAASATATATPTAGRLPRSFRCLLAGTIPEAWNASYALPNLSTL
jgi:hypothetical protein